MVFLGLTSLTAGMVFALVTLFGSHPARSTSLGAVAPRPAPSELALASVLLAPSPTPSPSVTATATLPPATPTPEPPTPTPTPAGPIKTGAAPPPQVQALSIAVVDEASGQLLYGRDPHRRLAPASVTKIFTALVALRYGTLNQQIHVTFDQSQLYDSTLMGLREGDTFTLEDLLYGLMLPSGNDAALAIANAIGGNETHFVEMMNEEAARLGLHDSHFVNPHGLDAPGHYTSAYDLAMAARYGMTHYEEFRKLAAARVWQVHGSRTYSIYNLNRFLLDYPGADGVKIGYTDNAGKTIVASATRNGHRVYVVLMHCGDIVADSVPLFNWVFSNFTWPASTPTATPSTAAQA